MVPSGPIGALCEWKMEAGTIPQPRLGFPSQRARSVFRRRGGTPGGLSPPLPEGQKFSTKMGRGVENWRHSQKKAAKRIPEGGLPPLDRGAVVYYNEMQIWKAGTENSTPRWGFRDGMAGANPTKARREGPLERGQAMARRLPTLRGSSVYLWYKFRWNHGSFDSP